jgi:hypothetical protein
MEEQKLKDEELKALLGFSLHIVTGLVHRIGSLPSS